MASDLASIQATPLPLGPERKNKAHPRGRACKVCGVELSVYNPNRTCWLHTKRERAKPVRGDWARNMQMKEMRRQGYTYEEIGEHFGVSRQRVNQILNG